MTGRQKAELIELRNDIETFRSRTQGSDVVYRLRNLSIPNNHYMAMCINDAIQEIEELRDALCKVMSIKSA